MTCQRGDGDALAATGYHVEFAVMHPPHAFDLRRAADHMEHWDAMPPVLLHLRSAPDALHSDAASLALQVNITLYKGRNHVPGYHCVFAQTM